MKQNHLSGGRMMAVYNSRKFSRGKKIRPTSLSIGWVMVGLLFFSAPAWADFGTVEKVKGGTIQRTNQERRLNNMLALDSTVYEKDILRGDKQAMAVLKTGFGAWHLGKNIELQINPNDKTLVEITHGKFKIISANSLHKALPLRVGNLEIQFMHKFGLVEEGEGEFSGGWLISGLAIITLRKAESVQRFEVSSEDWLIHYHIGQGVLKAYKLKRAKFLHKADNNSFFSDYHEIYANEVLDSIPFVAATPTPVPEQRKKVIRAPEELRLSEGQEQKVNLTGDPDLFLENYYQSQLRQQTVTPKATAKTRKAVKDKKSPVRRPVPIR